MLWPLCGNVTKNLGNEAIIAWRRIHDAENLKVEIEVAMNAHDELMERLKIKNAEKRNRAKHNKNT